MSDGANLMPPAGWYNDPQDQAQLRYWDGDQWTDQTRRVPGAEPAQPEPAPEQPAGPAADRTAGTEAELRSGFEEAVDVAPGMAPEVRQEPGSSAIRFADEVAAEPSPFRFAEADQVDVTATPETGANAIPDQGGADVLIATTAVLPGYRVTGILGEVHAVAVRRRSSLSNMGGGFRAMLGGEAEGYGDLLGESRREAVAGLRTAAAALGANAVVAMRFDSGEIAEMVNEVVAYGTAVVIEKE